MRTRLPSALRPRFSIFNFQFSILLLTLLATAPAYAQISFPGAGTAGKVTIDGSVQKRSGDEVDGTIVATVEDGWHINSNTPSEEFAIPTVLELDAATAFLTQLRANSCGKIHFPPFAWKQDSSSTFSLERKGGAKSSRRARPLRAPRRAPAQQSLVTGLNFHLIYCHSCQHIADYGLKKNNCIRRCRCKTLQAL